MRSVLVFSLTCLVTCVALYQGPTASAAELVVRSNVTIEGVEEIQGSGAFRQTYHWVDAPLPEVALPPGDWQATIVATLTWSISVDLRTGSEEDSHSLAHFEAIVNTGDQLHDRDYRERDYEAFPRKSGGSFMAGRCVDQYQETYSCTFVRSFTIDEESGNSIPAHHCLLSILPVASGFSISGGRYECTTHLRADINYEFRPSWLTSEFAELVQRTSVEVEGRLQSMSAEALEFIGNKQAVEEQALKEGETLKAVNEQAYKSPSAASGFPFPPYDNPFDGFFSTLVAGACEKAPSPSRFNDILHEVLLARDAIQLLTAPFTGPLDLLIGWGVFLLKQRLGADPLQDCISNGYALWYKNACCPQ